MKTIHSKDTPNIELLIELVSHSNKKLTVSEAGDIIFHTIKDTVVKNKDTFELSEEVADRLAISLLASMFMTLATLGLSESCIKSLCKSLGVPYPEEEDEESKGAEA